MHQLDRTTAAKSGEFLYRYMWARRRCCRAQTPDTRLAPLIESGKREFDGIEIEPHQSPPVVQDKKHPEFFAAIIELDDRAMPDLEDPCLASVRSRQRRSPEKAGSGIGISDTDAAMVG